MQWGRWLSSKVTQVSLTLFILVFTVFLLGFIADPIINLYVDPWNQITPGPSLYPKRPSAHVIVDDDDDWFSHFIKGFASLGVLGFVKVFFASPWNWFNLRGIFGGSGGRVGTTGRERATSISWVVLIVGVCTFLFAVWKGVRAWTRRTLEKAAERVMDVQGDAESNDDDD
ncbi:MAG: hypothetical protein M1828_002319 [Chrysothrix sp. TS-e1954]|nr:MAG: hypothetical protein M1828_002319 [Chrysothrix sp. TS-e1954]